jgi:hypothetical protein
MLFGVSCTSRITLPAWIGARRTASMIIADDPRALSVRAIVAWNVPTACFST